jgi:hypothetical protein
VCFCSGTSRVAWSILAAWATLTVAAALTMIDVSSGAFAVVGEHDVPEDGEDSVWHRHLHDEVGVMRYGHELGEHRSPEDGVVGGVEVRDLEHQVLCAEILLCAEGDCRHTRPMG